VDSEYVVKAVDWHDHKDHVILVMEDIHGKSLKSKMKEKRFPLERFLRMAVPIAKGLAAIHEKNIIHKDINPANIVWDSQTGNLKIIDFNIASKFDIKLSYLGNPEKLHGTLHYISPEQTGRMNRRVDHRTDLYSLGVTFYEMLTGQLPFRHTNPMDTVYSHLARDPEPPHLFDEQVPEILSKIVLKLLAKNPEERYQSAEGLIHDLEKAKRRKHADFKLGEKDFSGKLQIPEKLYGREREIKQLLNAYRRVSEERKEIVLVPGFSGTGKTALVDEIHVPITKDRGHFISGKFDQLQRTIPYFAFIQAFNQFCHLLLTEKQETLDQWKEKIMSAVGGLGKVLTDIIPQLESIIGTQPDVPELGGEEAQVRFNYLFQSFLQAVSTKEHPLVIFIDDMQWADLASLNLLQALMGDEHIRHLLFIGAYRDNEVSPSHPFITTMEEIQKQYGEMTTIPVKNLSIENVREWLQDTLMAPGSRDVINLADLIYEKTQGNAFFTIRFLENLYKENLLRFDFKQSRWVYDLAEIVQQNITDNVVHLMVQKIQTLPETGQEALKLAACIGSSFDLHTLSVISQKSVEEADRDLEIALTEHLIFPYDDEGYKFEHDRIHQAAYSLISDEEKKPLHLKIGRMLLKNYEAFQMSTGSQEVEKHLFDIVNHLNIGIDLIETEEEKLELLWLNLDSGRHARKSGAYLQGSDYVQKAKQLLPPNCWRQHYDLSLGVYNEAIQTSYLCGNFDELEENVEIVLQSSRDIPDKTAAYEFRMMGYIAQNKPDRAEDTFLDTFDMLGVTIPRDPGGEETMALLGKVQASLIDGGKENLKKLAMMSDLQKQLLFRLFTFGGATAIAHASQNLLPFVMGKMLEITQEHGLARDFPFVFACYGIIRNLMGDIPDAYQIGKIALDLLDIIPDTDINRPRAMVASCLYLLNWKEHYIEVSRRLKKNFQDALNVGDVEFAAYSLEYSALYLTRTDTELPGLKKTLEAAKKAAMQMKQPLLVNFVVVEDRVVSNLLKSDATPDFLVIDIEAYTKDMPPGVVQLVVYDIYIRKVFFAYLFDDYTTILDDIREAEKVWVTITIPIGFLKSDLYFYMPLVYLELYTRAEAEDEKKEYMDKAKEAIGILEQWAEFGPVNFLHKYYLAQAELFRVTGETTKAAEYYEKAIEKAFETEYINEAALANELAAKFYMQNHPPKFAAIYFRDARDCYLKWGAKAKAKDLEEKYPKYLNLGISGSIATTGTISSVSDNGTGDFLDVKSIIEASQTLSGEVQMQRFLGRMMQILIENAGAQKSILIEKTSEGLLIQAEGNTEGVSGILQELSAEGSGIVPMSIINYVARSKEQLVFENASKDANYSTDEYVQKNQPKSVVCFPVLSKGMVIAIIYLENNLVEGAFTSARLEVLNLLSSQIAISMENTQLYENLEEKVRHRTAALQKAKEELEEKHEELEESHRKINDSVSYASRIQTAVLPSPDNLSKLLPQHFLFYEPCSVVSGDFYWAKQVNKNIIVAAADCTGHGVPGALVSMLGMAFLNEIVLQVAQFRFTPADILDELRTQVKIALKQKGKLSEQKDGMDIALCVIDPDNNQLQYSGAYNPLYMVRDGELTEIEADKMPIGIYRKERPFNVHDVPFQKGDMIFLVTDGFAHQDREKDGAAFSKRRLKKLLTEISSEPTSKQREILIKRFEEWKGNRPQRDDVLVLGIRL
jgi:predicted ATPase/serine phosphatase RsbU (regulator of sigma subunit)